MVENAFQKYQILAAGRKHSTGLAWHKVQLLVFNFVLWRAVLEHNAWAHQADACRRLLPWAVDFHQGRELDGVRRRLLHRRLVGRRTGIAGGS